MVFLKRSATVLLVATLLSLASIAITPKANAQSLTALDNTQTCPMAQYIVVGQDCTKAESAVNEFIPTTAFIPSPTITPQENKKTQEKAIVERNYVPLPSVYESPTATLSADLLFRLVNNFRQSINLTPVQHDGEVCRVAETRRYDMVNEIFVTHRLHAGFYAENLPYWATENLIWANSEEAALNWWIHSPIHRAAIEGNYKYACGVCNGDVCDMVFTNYEPKVTAQSSSVPQDKKNSLAVR